jgi:Holliday junction resolvase RusA-like endonuclease
MKKDPICPISFYSDLLEVECTVPGKPFAKQRPRASRRGSFTTVYTPKETIEYENLVKYSYFDQTGGIMLDGALEADITGTFPIPKSVSKKQMSEMLNGGVYHTKKPDCDNMAKSVLDALNGVAYHDDSQIVKLHVSKQYGEIPSVKINLKQLEERK